MLLGMQRKNQEQSKQKDRDSPFFDRMKTHGIRDVLSPQQMMSIILIAYEWNIAFSPSYVSMLNKPLYVNLSRCVYDVVSI